MGPGTREAAVELRGVWRFEGRAGRRHAYGAGRSPPTPRPRLYERHLCRGQQRAQDGAEEQEESELPPVHPGEVAAGKRGAAGRRRGPAAGYALCSSDCASRLGRGVLGQWSAERGAAAGRLRVRNGEELAAA